MNKKVALSTDKSPDSSSIMGGHEQLESPLTPNRKARLMYFESVNQLEKGSKLSQDSPTLKK